MYDFLKSTLRDSIKKQNRSSTKLLKNPFFANSCNPKIKEGYENCYRK